MTLPWRKWPEEKPERGAVVIRAMGDHIHRNYAGGWLEEETIFWLYESDLLSTLPKE